MPMEIYEDPFEWFSRWLQEAKGSTEPEPTAMSLATVGPEGIPTVRIVLLKDFDRKGFVFYTNLKSEKGRDLQERPVAGLNFLWKALGRQVRIEGAVEAVTAEEADAYFAIRPRGSQIGAWASEQSRPLESRERLEAEVQRVEEEYRGRDVARPPHWSGFRLIPGRIEFWEAGEFRLHDRIEFRRSDEESPWERRRLFP